MIAGTSSQSNVQSAKRAATAAGSAARFQLLTPGFGSSERYSAMKLMRARPSSPGSDSG